MTTQKTNIRLLAALKYAELGWPVFPVWWIDKRGHCACGENCSSPGKHPIGRMAPQGWANARPSSAAPTDEEYKDDIDCITYWWSEYPRANIGLVTGDISGLMVFDVDPRNDGDVSLAKLIEEHGDFTAGAWHVSTGGGGDHYFFQWPNGQRAVTGLFPGIDIKADAGYVVAPPSVTYKAYQWVVPPKLHTAPPEAPAWLLAMLLETKPDKPTEQPLVEGDKYTIGNRHNYLVRRAGGLRHHGLSTDLLIQALNDLNQKWCDPPLLEQEVYHIATHAPWPEQKPKGIPLTTIDEETGEEVTEQAFYDLDDTGNAERFVAQYGQNFLYEDDWKWLAWTGTYWNKRGTLDAEQAAQASIASIKEEADAVDDLDESIRILKWLRVSRQGSRFESLLKIAKSSQAFRTSKRDFDQNHDLFNVQNGTFNLATGEFHEHRREDLITQIAPVSYEPDAECPKFLEYVRWAMLGDEEMVAFLQRQLGSTLQGMNREQTLDIWVGATGTNGKTTILNTMQDVMGRGEFGYAMEGDGALFSQKRGEKHKSEFAQLEGKRLVIIPEIAGSLDIPLIRRITGQKTFRANLMRENDREITTTFKLVMMVNEAPKVGNNAGESTWRRVRITDFDAKHTGPRIPNYEEHWKDELPGILNWLIDGCMDWLEGGMRPPAKVLAATREQRAESDPLTDFYLRHLRFSHKLKFATPTVSVYKEYLGWRLLNGIPYLMSQRQLTERIKAMGYQTERRGGNQAWFVGVALRSRQEKVTPKQG